MVTITGSLARLVAGGFGVSGMAGATVEIVAVHATEAPGYGFTSSVTVEARPLTITLTAGGAIPADTEILASSALRPAGSFHRVTWVLPGGSSGEGERISYDCLIGPDGGSCDITDPIIRLTGDAPVLAGWPPDLPPVPVYSSEGS